MWGECPTWVESGLPCYGPAPCTSRHSRAARDSPRIRLRSDPRAGWLRGGQKVVLGGNRQPGIVHVAGELLHDMGYERLFAVIAQGQELRGYRRYTHISPHQICHYTVAQSPVLEADANVFEPSLVRQGPQFLGRVECERLIERCFR